jgi:hypothetical protein
MADGRGAVTDATVQWHEKGFAQVGSPSKKAR